MSCLITRWTWYYCQPEARLNNTPPAVLTQEHRELYHPAASRKVSSKGYNDYSTTSASQSLLGLQAQLVTQVELKTVCDGLLWAAKGCSSLSFATEDRSGVVRGPHQLRSTGKNYAWQSLSKLSSTHLREYSFRAVHEAYFFFSGQATLPWENEKVNNYLALHWSSLRLWRLQDESPPLTLEPAMVQYWK